MRRWLDKALYRYFHNECAILSLVLLIDVVCSATDSSSISTALRQVVERRKNDKIEA